MFLEDALIMSDGYLQDVWVVAGDGLKWSGGCLHLYGPV